MSRNVAGKPRAKLASLLPQNHPFASIEVDCRGLNPREVRKLFRRVIRLEQIDNPKVYIETVKTKFSLNNTIHKILSIESEMFDSSDIDLAYKLLDEILEGVKSQLSDEMRPEDKLKLVYKIIREKGFKLIENEIENENALLIDCLLERTLDCDASSFVVLAIAEQLDWPVKLVGVLGHVFVRWEGRDVKINIDYGKILEDQYYIEEFSWDRESLDLNGIIAVCYYNRGVSKFKLGLYAEAYTNRGYAKSKLGRDKDADMDWRKAEEFELKEV